MSMTKIEYMAVPEAAKEALWLRGLVKELGVQQGGVQLHCDSRVLCTWQRTRCIVQGPSISM